ncbi:MAG TPA: hypothetical protein VE173_09540 [Longimicrobiales bacterium]|nr:hypothetical protein [Longimicrobiales bacterium]
MYDELERAVAGRPRRGMSALGWIAVGLAVLFFMGGAGALVAFHVVRTQVREFSEPVQQEPALRASEALNEVLANVFAGLEPATVASDPEVGRKILRNLESGALDEAALQDIIEGSLRVRTEKGDVTADLHGDETGGSLVIRSPEGEVHVELVRGEDGGELVIRSDGEAVRLGAGMSAPDLPGWVPRPDGMPAGPRPVFSATSGKGAFGVVTWEAPGAPEDMVAAYRDGLADEGYDLRAEHSLRGESARSASVVGRDDATRRMVFLVASREDGVTKVVLGFGEGDGR